MSGVYIHIPYCHSKCAYCDFHSVVRRDTAEELVRCLSTEWALRSGECGNAPNTIYIGGGTPTSLPPDLLSSVLDLVPREGVAEFTVETNPEDVTDDLCHMLIDHGVNRLSMGVQSFNDKELRILSRGHDATRAAEAIESIVRSGLTNYSIDLIYGIPGQTLSDFAWSLDKLLQMRPPHFSAYILSYEPRTRLTAMLKSGKIEQAADTLILDMYNLLCDKAREYGYRHYEISNFALHGKEAVHNSNYWNGTPYLGLGPSAHSYDGAIRRINPTLTPYLQRLRGGETAFEIDEESDDSRFNDKVITALRTSEGLDTTTIEANRLSVLLADATPHIANGTMRRQGNRLVIDERAWPVSDAILTDLMQID